MTKTAERTVLVLQGGGALGAYQAGAVEALDAAQGAVDWVAGISIGAINAALVIGNPPERRVPALRAFWERATGLGLPLAMLDGVLPGGWLNDMSAASTTLIGVPGFFSLRMPPAAFMPQGSIGALSYYDTAPLRDTLLELVDFERINSGPQRLSVGAVNVETGNMTWFDSASQRIGPEHIMASGALPPGFPAIEIDGQKYWDGGLVSNTPLQYVLDSCAVPDDLCIFQIDLFSARGAMPRSVWDIEAREKDIRFSSRTRFNTDMMRRLHETRAAARRLHDKLPEALKADPDAQALVAGGRDPRITIAHLIYRQTRFEHGSKDYEFSRRSMRDHWVAGARDVSRTLAHPDWRDRHGGGAGVRVFDLTG